MLFVVRDVMRTLHLIAGGTWVGGSVIYLFVIAPALRLRQAAPAVAAEIAALFRKVVNLCIGVLLLSGVYLIFDRLNTPNVGPAYVGVLVVKIASSLAMILLAVYQAQEARRLAKRRGRLWKLTPRLILALGLLTFLLGATLTGLFELSLSQ
jgi:putative copper export protein